MSEANDLEVLGSVWRTEVPTVPVDLPRRVRRQSTWMRVHAAIDLLVSVTFLGTSSWWAVAHPTPEFVVLAIGVWIITLSALIYSFANRAGTWEATGQNTGAYLTLCLRRCRAGLAAIRFGFYLVAVEVVLLTGWHAWYWSTRNPPPAVQTWLLAACLPAAFLIALLALRAHRRRELARLESLERELIG
jgi:hypothetical protein